MLIKTLTIALVFFTSFLLHEQEKEPPVGPPLELKEADMSVFGMYLGGKFEVPECPRLTNRKGKELDLYAFPKSLCFKWSGISLPKPNTPVVTATVGAEFPSGLNTAPSIVDGLAIECTVFDGNLESVFFSTGGLKSQDDVLAQLEKKYGRPTLLTEASNQNYFGGVFTSHVAFWKFKNLTVSFCGTTDRLDDGSVRISTDKGLYFLTKSEEKASQAPTL